MRRQLFPDPFRTPFFSGHPPDLSGFWGPPHTPQPPRPRRTTPRIEIISQSSTTPPEMFARMPSFVDENDTIQSGDAEYTARTDRPFQIRITEESDLPTATSTNPSQPPGGSVPSPGRTTVKTGPRIVELDSSGSIVGSEVDPSMYRVLCWPIHPTFLFDFDEALGLALSFPKPLLLFLDIENSPAKKRAFFLNAFTPELCTFLNDNFVCWTGFTQNPHRRHSALPTDSERLLEMIGVVPEDQFPILGIVLPERTDSVRLFPHELSIGETGPDPDEPSLKLLAWVTEFTDASPPMDREEPPAEGRQSATVAGSAKM
ncbi:hypothetical protein PAPYR_3133 [Paratrimastix pyriformis]|uniref:Uncharacterized protein n=1 Tax=Paratrimastix pyriformis TaxID=342808 RepID=A0ABQ8UR27_9EUKA|nr:hypothetical protein PAPYR_3133 [Paratrimastix pyriformis]